MLCIPYVMLRNAQAKMFQANNIHEVALHMRFKATTHISMLCMGKTSRSKKEKN